MNQPSDEIKSRLDIVDVIREYIPLKAAGINFRARCPFHREKDPSFMVSPEKQIWHCFGCGKGGDIFSFVMEMEGVNFVEALRQLAPKAGVTLRQHDPKLTSKRNSLLDIIEFSSNYYHKILLTDEQAKLARDYLKERALTKETIKEFKIGYSPDSWDDLFNLLRKKGYSENEIFLAGMSVKRENSPGFYNRFRGRIIFPINDVNGNTVAFSARVSPENEEKDKMGKYINSPQTIIYDKSKIIFGLDKAKLKIKNQDLTILVEGQMDVITAHQHGFKNVVATSGTALTREQIKLIKRYSNNIALAFDMDRAGELAAERGIVQGLQAEMNIKVIELQQGKDPDECIKQAPGEWQRAVKLAKPVMEYYFDKTFSCLDLEKVEDKRKAVKIILPIIAKIENKIERDFWLKKLCQKLDIKEGILEEVLNASIINADKYKKRTINEITNPELKISRMEMLSEILIALILKFPMHLDYIVDNISTDYLFNSEIQSIYNNLIIYYNKISERRINQGQNEINLSYQDFRKWLEKNNIIDGYNNQPQAQNGNLGIVLDRLVILADKDFHDYTREQAKIEIINILKVLKKQYLSNRLKEIAKLISQIEKENFNIEKLDNLMQEFKILTEEIKELEE